MGHCFKVKKKNRALFLRVSLAYINTKLNGKNLSDKNH